MNARQNENSAKMTHASRCKKIAQGSPPWKGAPRIGWKGRAPRKTKPNFGSFKIIFHQNMGKIIFDTIIQVKISGMNNTHTIADLYQDQSVSLGADSRCITREGDPRSGKEGWRSPPPALVWNLPTSARPAHSSKMSSLTGTEIH